MYKNYKTASSSASKLAFSNATTAKSIKSENPEIKALINQRNKLRKSISKQKRKNE
jgi:capsule polysaccharide export protein KpsE/RkpR